MDVMTSSSTSVGSSGYSLDLLHGSETEPERFERKRAAIEAALDKAYREGVDRDFKGFAQVLAAIPDGNSQFGSS